MAKYYTIVCNNFKAKNVTKIMANITLQYAIISRLKKVTTFMAKYYTIVCNNFKAKNVTKFMANIRFF